MYVRRIEFKELNTLQIKGRGKQYILNRSNKRPMGHIAHMNNTNHNENRCLELDKKYLDNAV